MTSLPDRPRSSGRDARPATVAAVLGAWALCVLLLLLYLEHRPKPTSSVGATAAPTAAFPGPPAGAVVFSREAGPDALALGVVPLRRRCASRRPSSGRTLSACRASTSLVRGRRRGGRRCRVRGGMLPSDISSGAGGRASSRSPPQESSRRAGASRCPRPGRPSDAAQMIASRGASGAPCARSRSPTGSRRIRDTSSPARGRRRRRTGSRIRSSRGTRP